MHRPAVSNAYSPDRRCDKAAAPRRSGQNRRPSLACAGQSSLVQGAQDACGKRSVPVEQDALALARSLVRHPQRPGRDGMHTRGLIGDWIGLNICAVTRVRRRSTSPSRDLTDLPAGCALFAK